MKSMLKPAIEKALNEQLKEEMNSFYIYLAMSAYLESKNFPGMASWMGKQAQEELSHAMKFFGYIHERGGSVTLQALDKPKATWASPAAVFKAAAAHEKHISGCIDALVDAAAAERDHATGNFLQWFVKEQVEEEATVGAIVQRFAFAGEQPAALLFLDRDLGSRQ